jgi:preprotein translocase subunit SecG
MHTVVTFAQIILSFLLVTVILIQQRGTSLGDAFGGGGTVYRSKRGIERTLHRATIFLALLFVGLAFGSLFLR